MAQCSANDLISQACQSGFTCRSEPELLALLNQLLCNYSQAAGGYVLTFVQGTGNNPIDGATNYFGGGNLNSTSYSDVAVLVPKAGTITRFFMKARVVVAGSAETVQHFVRINDTTDVGQINLTYDASSSSSLNTTVNQAVAEGDSLAVKMVFPTWATNPTGVLYYGYVYIE